MKILSDRQNQRQPIPSPEHGNMTGDQEFINENLEISDLVFFKELIIKLPSASVNPTNHCKKAESRDNPFESIMLD